MYGMRRWDIYIRVYSNIRDERLDWIGREYAIADHDKDFCALIESRLNTIYIRMIRSDNYSNIQTHIIYLSVFTQL